MNYIKHQTGVFERFSKDKRINPFHISLYFSLFHFWNKNRFRNPFPISREDLMFLAHIGSVNTYTKCIKQLHQWGYIEYIPSYNPTTGSKVSCIRFDNGSDNGNDKTANRATDKSSDRALYKNRNTINGNKPGQSQNFNNGKEKKYAGRFHVNIDKDYSEPL